MSVNSGVLVKVGVAKLWAALAGGGSVQISTARISSDVMTCTGDEIAMTNVVYVVPTGVMTATPTSDGKGLLFVLTLDQSIGTFIVGTIGLFYSDDTLFALAAFPGAGQKIASSLPAVIGNNRTLQVLVQYDQLAAGVSG